MFLPILLKHHLNITTDRDIRFIKPCKLLQPSKKADSVKRGDSLLFFMQAYFFSEEVVVFFTILVSNLLSEMFLNYDVISVFDTSNISDDGA